MDGALSKNVSVLAAQPDSIIAANIIERKGFKKNPHVKRSKTNSASSVPSIFGTGIRLAGSQTDERAPAQKTLGFKRLMQLVAENRQWRRRRDGRSFDTKWDK